MFFVWSIILSLFWPFAGDRECYVHIPENFFAQNYRPEKHKLEATKYIVTVQIEGDNVKLEPISFTLRARAGHTHRSPIRYLLLMVPR